MLLLIQVTVVVPLVDINGNVIGINSAKYADTEVEGDGLCNTN